MSGRKLPDDVRAAIARAMGYNDEGSLYYWGTGGAAKRYDDTLAALAALWPPDPPPPHVESRGQGKEPRTGPERALRGLLTEFRTDDCGPAGTALVIIFGRGESSQGAACSFLKNESAPEVAHKLMAIAQNIAREVKP